MKKSKLKPVIVSEPLKLNLGAGQNPKEGFKSVDRRKFPNTDIVTDLTQKWPWGDETVAEIWMEHCLEHFTGPQRVHIFNEMGRVLQKGGIATILTPSWTSARAYGDFTHQWPPVCEQLYQYLNREWRLAQAPDTDIKFNPDGYSCDLQATVGWRGFHPELVGRSDETVRWWLTFGKEAAQDIMATITKP